MSKILTMAGSSFCTVSGLLTATGAETVYDTTVAIPFCIEGIAFSRAAVTDGVMPLVDHNAVTLVALAASEGCALFFLLNAAGTVSVMQGEVEALDADDDSFLVAPNFPDVPDGSVPFAYMILTNGAAGSTFTIGTSNWNATGMTVSIKNLMTVPERPQES